MNNLKKNNNRWSFLKWGLFPAMGLFAFTLFVGTIRPLPAIAIVENTNSFECDDDDDCTDTDGKQCTSPQCSGGICLQDFLADGAECGGGEATCLSPKTCQSCQCLCPKDIVCSEGMSVNPNTCNCECTRECPPGEVLNPFKCACEVDKCPDDDDDLGNAAFSFENGKEIIRFGCNTDSECNVILQVAKSYDSNVSAVENIVPSETKMVCENCECVSACSVKTCDDGNACTSDSCNDATGECEYTAIPNCPPPPPPLPPIQEQALPNPCVATLSAMGLDPALAAQGVCSGSLEGQTTRCTGSHLLGTIAVPGPWQLVIPLLTTTGGIIAVRVFRRGKK